MKKDNLTNMTDNPLNDIKGYTSYIKNLERLRAYYFGECFYDPASDCWIFENGNKLPHIEWVRIRDF